MPKNDPVSDVYSGGEGTAVVEFDEISFDEMEEGELFWFSESANDMQNNAFRKLNDSNAENTRTGQTEVISNSRLTVYQKT
tara:strand:- start:909 stop:1151 length:243 start_codon:yes stop_codon:yes gene_type:complete